MTKKKNRYQNKVSKRSRELLIKEISTPQQNKTSPRSPSANLWKFIVAITILIGGIAGCITIWAQITKSRVSTFKEQVSLSGDLKPKGIWYQNPEGDINLLENAKILGNHLKYSNSSKYAFKVFLAEHQPRFDSVQDNNYPKVLGLHVKDFVPHKLIYVECGNTIFYLDSDYFLKGVEVLKTVGYNHADASIYLALKGDRLYISTEFKSLENEETIGVINYNHWTLFKDNMLPPSTNDTMLEVRDKQNKIAFSIKYGQTSMLTKPGGKLFEGVVLRGYFIGDTTISIVSSHEKDNYSISKRRPDWKEMAAVAASGIESLWR